MSGNILTSALGGIGADDPAEKDWDAWEAHLRYQEFFDFVPDAYLVTDLAGIILEANHAAATLLRTRKEFLIGKPLPLFAIEGSRGSFYDLLVWLREGRTVGQWHATLQLLRGQTVDVFLCGASSPGGESRHTRLRWLLGDGKARLTAESALRAEHDFAEGLLHATQAIVLVLDERGTVLRASPYLERLCGRQEETLRGRAWEELLPTEERATGRKMVHEALIRGASQGYRGELQTPDGCRHVAWTARSLSDRRLRITECGVRSAECGANDNERPAAASSNGHTAIRNPQSTSILVVGHDVTDLHEAQDQALRAERLAAIGQVMASLAHESRNLLQRSQACLERLSWRLQDRPEALELAARAQQAQHDLAHLLEDVRVYAAPLHLDLAPCDVRETWREAWSQVEAVFPGKRSTLCEDVDPPDLWCMADRFRLLQVFRNLLENSFAACPDELVVEIECCEAEDNDRRMMRLVFRDNGPGIALEHRHRLFEPFWTTRPQGSGLGLVIVRRIVEAHGGTIAVSDRGPPGAEIIVTLPRDLS